VASSITRNQGSGCGAYSSHHIQVTPGKVVTMHTFPGSRPRDHTSGGVHSLPLIYQQLSGSPVCHGQSDKSKCCYSSGGGWGGVRGLERVSWFPLSLLWKTLSNLSCSFSLEFPES
jgi:hypothetical protein